MHIIVAYDKSRPFGIVCMKTLFTSCIQVRYYLATHAGFDRLMNAYMQDNAQASLQAVRLASVDAIFW